MTRNQPIKKKRNKRNNKNSCTTHTAIRWEDDEKKNGEFRKNLSPLSRFGLIHELRVSLARGVLCVLFSFLIFRSEMDESEFCCCCLNWKYSIYFCLLSWWTTVNLTIFYHIRHVTKIKPTPVNVSTLWKEITHYNIFGYVFFLFVFVWRLIWWALMKFNCGMVKHQTTRFILICVVCCAFFFFAVAVGSQSVTMISYIQIVLSVRFHLRFQW